MSKKLDIKEVLRNIDANNKDWLSSLDEEDAQKFDPFIVMQFLSSSNNDLDHFDTLQITNEVLNKNFTTIYSNKDLFYRLCCLCRAERKTFRPFIKPPKSKKTLSVIQKLMLEHVAENLTESECNMMIRKNKIYGIDFWCELAESYDWSESDVKKLVKELKQII